MSVIVSEMPDNCLECPLSYFDYYFTDPPLKCPLMSDMIELDKTKRHKDCPLKSVDGLIEEIKRKGYCKDEYGCIRADILTVGCVAKIIKEYCGMEEE